MERVNGVLQILATWAVFNLSCSVPVTPKKYLEWNQGATRRQGRYVSFTLGAV